MILLVITYILIICIQLLLNIYALLTNRSIPREYSYALLSRTEPAVALEHYVKIFRPVDIKVNASIKLPAVALDNFVLINKKKMYQADLYTNFFLLFQLELSKKAYGFVRNSRTYLGVSFLISVIIFMVGLLIEDNKELFLSISIGIQICTILFSYFAKSSMNTLLANTEYIAYDLLNLDDAEQRVAHKLSKELRVLTYEYPLFIIRKVVGFFVPRIGN